MQVIIRTIKRCVDQKRCWPNNLLDTSSPTIGLFYDKYMGPPFFIHYKYSYILTYVFVAFTWGSILPFMFFLSIIGLIVMFIVEKLMVYYSYPHPPMLDNSMSDQAIKILYIAPFFLCLSGAWAFSIPAIYLNDINEVHPLLVHPDPEHYVS